MARRLLQKKLRHPSYAPREISTERIPSPAAKTDMPYRLYVPTTWDGLSKLPLIVMFHSDGFDENRYMDMNDRQMLHLAEQHGYIVVSPLGYSRLGACPARHSGCRSFWTTGDRGEAESSSNARSGDALELSEKDVINVLEIVLNEYPINRSSVFLMGHSMGAGGTWYLGAKYSKLLARHCSHVRTIRRPSELSLGPNSFPCQ